MARRGDAQADEDLLGSGARVRSGHPVKAPGVHEVLHRRELLEERRLDRDPVDEALHGKLVRADVETEHGHRAFVRLEQRREAADERGLTGAVRPEERVDLAAGDRERHAVDRPHVFPGRTEALDDVACPERGLAGLDRGRTDVFADCDGHCADSFHARSGAHCLRRYPPE